MIKRGNKKGQIYLLAAIIIIALVIGLLAVTNYSKKNKNSIVYELAEELKIESSKVLDNGAVTGNYKWDEFTKNFSDYAGKNINIIYIVGNSSTINAFKYDETGEKRVVPSIYINEQIIINAGAGLSRKFNIREGENFYFIIYQDIEGERYVATNE